VGGASQGIVAVKSKFLLIASIVVVAVIALYLIVGRAHVYHATGVVSLDTGVRDVVHDGKRCQEYYRLKDELPLRTVCPP
jgi:hypothetical protein